MSNFIINAMSIVSLFALGALIGVLAAFYANKSSKEAEGEALPVRGWAMLIIVCGVLSVLSLIPYGGQVIMVIALIILTIFRALNNEGDYRDYSWRCVTLLTIGLLIFSVAVTLDASKKNPNAGVIILLIPIFAPLIAGKIRLHHLNKADADEEEEETEVRGDGILKKVALSAVAAGVVLIAIALISIAIKL